MSEKHRVFISYHHANDQAAKNSFCQQFASVFVDVSIREGDIDDDLPTDTIRQKIRDKWLRDSTVTIVLVGKETWKRKHVDWEIGSSLRDTKHSSRSGLLGLLLPSYPGYATNNYDNHTIPPRLADNLQGSDPFAQLYKWPTNGTTLQDWVHAAFVRRKRQPDPDNSRPSFVNNRTGERWYD